MNDQQYLNVSEFHLSSKGHFPVVCKTGEVCDSLKEYLKSEHWQNIRSAFYSTQQRYVCAYCQDDGKLHLHHQTYERIGKEFLTDLIQLCESCHNFVHVFIDNYGRPPTPRERDSRWTPEQKSRNTLLISSSSPIREHNEKKRNARKEVVISIFGRISNQKLNKLMSINGLGKRAYMTKVPLIYKIAEKWKQTRKVDCCKIENPNAFTCHTTNNFCLPIQAISNEGWPDL